jgi:hypothetical protein
MKLPSLTVSNVSPPAVASDIDFDMLPARHSEERSDEESLFDSCAVKISQPVQVRFFPELV